jgi:hypothetical protein
MPPLRQAGGKGQPAGRKRPGGAWRAAENAGVDLSLLEHSLSLSAGERLVEHQRALALAETLEKAKIKPCQI